MTSQVLGWRELLKFPNDENVNPAIGNAADEEPEVKEQRGWASADVWLSICYNEFFSICWRVYLIY